MTLYKYIGFDRNYWAEPILRKELYFSTIADLQRGNDRHEFVHYWYTTSYVFLKFGLDMPKYYDEYFAATRILCLSQSLSKRCWDEYCGGGGVVYEFDFNPSIMRQLQITFASVAYADSKNHFVPDYIIKNAYPQPAFQSLLRKTGGLNLNELKAVREWMGSGVPTLLSVRHITDELAFKKLNSFAFEDELRIAHLTRAFGSTPLKVQLHDSRLAFKSLGIKIRCIHTSDRSKVSTICSPSRIEIRTIPY